MSGTLHAVALVLQALRYGEPMLVDGQVRILEVQPVDAGGTGELSVTITEPPATGHPLKVRLRGDVALVENRLGWDDVVDPAAQQPRLRTTFLAPAQPGRYRVHGWVRYVTCTADACRPRWAQVEWDVAVVDPDA